MEDLVKFAVDTASTMGASYSEARFQRNEGIRLVFKNGIPDPAGFTKKSGIAVRVLINGALGFACTNTLTKERIRATVESAYRTAKESGRLVKIPIRMAGRAESRAKWSAKEKLPLADVSVEERLSLLSEAERSLTDTPTSMKLVARLLDLSSETEEKVFANSEGALVFGTVPRTSFFVLLTGASDKGTIQRWNNQGESGGWRS